LIAIASVAGTMIAKTITGPYKALTLPSMTQFLDSLFQNLGLVEADARVCRLPPYSSQAKIKENQGKISLGLQMLFGTTNTKTGLISLYPPLYWLDKSAKPDTKKLSVDEFIDFMLATIMSLIHELLHRSGRVDESEVRELVPTYTRYFGEKYMLKFGEELRQIKPIWNDLVHSVQRDRKRLCD
jgi:hypothetical protein